MVPLSVFKNINQSIKNVKMDHCIRNFCCGSTAQEVYHHVTCKLSSIMIKFFFKFYQKWEIISSLLRTKIFHKIKNGKFIENYHIDRLNLTKTGYRRVLITFNFCVLGVCSPNLNPQYYTS